MKLLITGALDLNMKFQTKIEKMGYDIVYVKDETREIDFDVSDIEGIICNSFFVFNDINKFEKIKFIQITSAGLDRVPLEVIKEKDIKLFNAKDIYSVPISEWIILKILEIYKQSKFFYTNQASKEWNKNRSLDEIYGKTACIVGYGNIGREVAKRLDCFGVNILTVDKEDSNEPNRNFYHIRNIRQALKKSDIVVLTLPLTEHTMHFINDEMLSNFKENSVLINVSRGQIIEERALVKYLENGHLLGAALDVFNEEPLDKKNALWEQDKLLVSPHNAFYSKQNSLRLKNLIIRNLKSQSEDLK